MKTSFKFLLLLFGLNLAFFSCSAESIDDDTLTEITAIDPPKQDINKIDDNAND
jgi:hypothetical protein